MAEDLRKLKIEMKLRDATGEEKNFTTIRSLEKFFQQETSFWQEKSQSIQNVQRLNQVRDVFNACNREISQFITNFPQWDANNQQQQTNQLPNKISQHLREGAFSSTPFSHAFLEACELGQNQALVFWQYVLQHGSSRVDNVASTTLEGAILGYEFMRQDETVIYKRREAEKRGFSVLRKTLSEKTDALIGEVEQFEAELIDWKQQTIAALAENREEDLKLREEFFTEAATKKQELESLYGEVLRLKEPARYWNERAGKYKKSGERWGASLVATTFLTAGVFIWLLQQWMSSDRILEKFTAHHWQGIVLLTAILSLAAFLIRVFGKLTFSAFHLQRDAEEREQLAYFYLALLNETEVDEGARSIVFQSLFSRSETGLLSAEHGPIMPASDALKQFRAG